MWMFTNTVGRFRTQSLFTAWGWRQIDMATQRPLDFVWCFQCAKRREMNRTECGSFRIHGFGFGFGFRLRPLNAYAKHAHYVETIAGAKLAWAEKGLYERWRWKMATFWGHVGVFRWRNLCRHTRVCLDECIMGLWWIAVGGGGQLLHVNIS